MAFKKEPTSYYKTALSDLQGSWGNLREAVVNNFNFTKADKLLFHIDEAMSWENVRDLEQMKQIFILVQNIAIQSKAPDEVMEWVDAVRDDLAEVLAAIANGEVL